jgi:hypothetical protein
VDVHYLSTGGARAAAVPAGGAAFAPVLAGRTAAVPRAAPCRPGEFSLRELPPLRAVLAGLSGLGPPPAPRTWSGAWPTGTGGPTRCAAPAPSREQARPQLS